MSSPSTASVMTIVAMNASAAGRRCRSRPCNGAASATMNSAKATGSITERVRNSAAMMSSSAMMTGEAAARGAATVMLAAFAVA